VGGVRRKRGRTRGIVLGTGGGTVIVAGSHCGIGNSQKGARGRHGRADYAAEIWGRCGMKVKDFREVKEFLRAGGDPKTFQGGEQIDISFRKMRKGGGKNKIEKEGEKQIA